jgi:hypothetical protein
MPAYLTMKGKHHAGFNQELQPQYSAAGYEK